ncbi:sulfotransferase family 2 domain-containing protein [Corallincola platygyrae]|uniref:Sulfotransferase family 2 domain-containing protein n=1 Tax=Corallincola platygyrae TaxID=1193278 RepID=A0ABW4XLB5_9GAMM
MDKYECIYIHIPKAAGTSVLSALMDGDPNPDRDHTGFKTYLESNPAKFNRYFKFSFVRDPWDRLISVYTYLKGGGNGGADRYFEQLIADKYPTFEDFVLEYLDKDRIHQHILLRPQFLFLYDHKDECRVDFVGRLESIDDDFENVAARLKLECKLPKSNRSKRKKKEAYLSNPKVINKIADLYSRDIELFGYQMPASSIDT